MRKGRFRGTPGRAIWLAVAAAMGWGLLFAVPTAGGAVGTVQVKAEDLLARPDRYAGQVVTMTEEVIGEVMYRGDWAWVNIGGKGWAIGVWVHRTLADKIQTGGSYSHRGDTVLVTGEFRLACPEHGGDTDLHAFELDVVMPGGAVPRPASLLRWVLGLALCAAGVVFTLLDLSRSRRRARELPGQPFVTGRNMI
jgi:hypothetical protein